MCFLDPHHVICVFGCSSWASGFAFNGFCQIPVQTHRIILGFRKRDSKEPVKSEYAVLKNSKSMRLETRLTGSLSKIMHHVQPKPCLLQGDSPFCVLLGQECRWINGEDAFADHPLCSDGELLLHKRKILFPSLGMTLWHLGFDEVEQVYLSKCICCTPALRTKGFQAGGVAGRRGESLWTDLLSMAFSFPRYRGGEANEQQPNEPTQDRGGRFLCQNNNNLDEVSRDSRMNVQSDSD